MQLSEFRNGQARIRGEFSGLIGQKKPTETVKVSTTIPVASPQMAAARTGS
jgi:hypothetical protein